MILNLEELGSQEELTISPAQGYIVCMDCYQSFLFSKCFELSCCTVVVSDGLYFKFRWILNRYFGLVCCHMHQCLWFFIIHSLFCIPVVCKTLLSVTEIFTYIFANDIHYYILLYDVCGRCRTSCISSCIDATFYRFVAVHRTTTCLHYCFL